MIITGLMTGHCPSRYHLKKVGKIKTSECRFGQADNKTAEQLLCNCGALLNQRMSIFGKGLLETSEIWQSNPNRVIDPIFVRYFNTNRLS